MIRYRAQQLQPACSSNSVISSPSRVYAAVDVPVYRGKMSSTSLVTVAVPPAEGHQSPSLRDLFPPTSPSTSGSSPTSGPVVVNQVPFRYVLPYEFLQLKKKMSTMKRKSDETLKSQEETISQQNSL